MSSTSTDPAMATASLMMPVLTRSVNTPIPRKIWSPFMMEMIDIDDITASRPNKRKNAFIDDEAEVSGPDSGDEDDFDDIGPQDLSFIDDEIHEEEPERDGLIDSDDEGEVSLRLSLVHETILKTFPEIFFRPRQLTVDEINEIADHAFHHFQEDRPCLLDFKRTLAALSSMARSPEPLGPSQVRTAQPPSSHEVAAGMVDEFMRLQSMLKLHPQLTLAPKPVERPFSPTSPSWTPMTSTMPSLLPTATPMMK